MGNHLTDLLWLSGCQAGLGECLLKGSPSEDSSEIGGRGVHFLSAVVKHRDDLRNRVNSQRYSCIYEDWKPKIVEDIEKSEENLQGGRGEHQYTCWKRKTTNKGTTNK